MPQRALSGEVLTDDTSARERDVYAELHRLRTQVHEMQSKLMEAGLEYGRLRRENEALLASMRDLRRYLSPFHTTLQAIFGELEAVRNSTETSPATDPRTAQVWEAWKQRLGGLPAKAIDALLLHGEMNRTQLRIALQCATRSITDVVYKLNQAGLINKNGGKISLKEMK